VQNISIHEQNVIIVQIAESTHAITERIMFKTQNQVLHFLALLVQIQLMHPVTNLPNSGLCIWDIRFMAVCGSVWMEVRGFGVYIRDAGYGRER
jgi:hypothetical protein